MKFGGLERINSAVLRGRVTNREGYESARSKVGPDGTFSIEGLKPGAWFFAFEEPGRASTIVGPVALTRGNATRVDLAVNPGAAIEGRVEHVPYGMAGAIWVVAFDDRIVRREVRVAPDGSFRLEGLPPGRYGLKAGHDGYEDPHSLMNMKEDDFATHREFLFQRAEPWLGAVVVEAVAGGTARGVVLDFNPPRPFVLPGPRPEEKPAPK